MPAIKYSRRAFVKQGSLTGLAITLGRQASSVFANALFPPGTTLPNPEEPIIDIHQHTNYSGRNDKLLLAHQAAMGISKTILLPGGRSVDAESTHHGISNGLEVGAGGNEVCYQFAMQHPQQYAFGACEVPDLSDATTEIERYLKLGAKVIGELKFGIDCDSPAMQKIYKLAENYNVPVLMHWQFEKYNYGYERFYKMLEKYPKVIFLGHAQTWWANVDKNQTDQKNLYPTGKVTKGGLTDKMLQDYSNMYADLSAGSGLNFLTRDEDFTKDFLKRHQHKLLFGSDCSDRVGSGKECQGSQTIAAIRRLSPNKKIERKLLYENAQRLFRL